MGVSGTAQQPLTPDLTPDVTVAAHCTALSVRAAQAGLSAPESSGKPRCGCLAPEAAEALTAPCPQPKHPPSVFGHRRCAGKRREGPPSVFVWVGSIHAVACAKRKKSIFYPKFAQASRNPSHFRPILAHSCIPESQTSVTVLPPFRLQIKSMSSMGSRVGKRLQAGWTPMGDQSN